MSVILVATSPNRARLPGEPARPGASLSCLLLVLLVASACERAPEGTLGSELRHGDLGVTVTGYDLRYLDLQAENGGVVTTQTPVLLIHLTATNHGQAALRYDTRESATVAQQGVTPLLFVDPGPDGEWRTPAHNIPLVSTGAYRYLGDPVTGLATIGAGETLQDVLLFEAPPAGTTRLVLSLPPTIFGPGVEQPALIRIPYEPLEPTRPPVVGVGEPAEGEGFALRVESAEVAYWPNTDGSAFSEEPLLVLHYSVINRDSEPLQYRPPHRDPTGTTAPALSDGTRLFSRVQLREGWPAEQLREGVLVAPGEAVSDLALFERPDRSVSQLLLFFPGQNVGRPGQVRVRLDYQYSDPPLPAELLPPDPEEAPDEETEEEGD